MKRTFARHALTVLLSALTLAASAATGTVGARAAAPASLSPGASVSLDARTLHGHPAGIQPRVGASARVHALTTAAGTNPYCGRCAPPLVFHTGNAVGGGLTGTAGQITLTNVYWMPSGYQYTSRYQSIVDGYVTNLAAAGMSANNVFAPANQYYQTLSSVTHQIRYQVSAGTPFTLTDAFPANYPGNAAGCQPDAGFTGCVTDAALETELQNRLVSLGKPIDDAHVYMVMFPFNTLTLNPVMTCMEPGTSTQDLTQACSSNVYCAYHSGFFKGPSSNQYVLYANEPFPGLSGCSSPGVLVQSPNGDSHADIVLSSYSHEANEVLTDWQGAWYDTAGFENGDECAYVYGASLGSTGVAGDGLQNGTAYNQTINGAHYFTQDEFSNEDYAANLGTVVDGSNSSTVRGCVQGEEAPAAAFSVPAAAANVSAGFTSTSTDADNGSGIANYLWNWGDGTSSTSTSSASTTHTFTTAGTFPVGLTVTDIGGWTGSVSHSVLVSNTATVPDAPTNVAATPGNGQAGLTWTAPSANGSPITGYQVQPFINGIGQPPVLTGSTATSFTVTGLTNGTTYTFKVAAINGIGTGPQSAASNAVTPSLVTAPGQVTGLSATAGVGSAYLNWNAPSNGGSAITGYRVTQIQGLNQTQIPTVSTATNFTVAGLNSTLTYTFTVAAINAAGTGLDSLPSGSVSPVPGGTYTPLVPARILDTRSAIGVPARPAAPLGPGQTLNLQVTGQGGVPASGVSSVVLNVTVTDTTAGSYLTVWPQGVTQPVVSSLNWVPGKTVANLVEVAVGNTGMVSFFNPTGSTDVIVDVQGYVGDATDSYHRSGLFNPLPPGRDLDTRSGVGAPRAQMGPGAVLNLHVLGVNGVPSTGVSAVVLNVTAVLGTAAGYLTVWPTGNTQPTASNLNFLAGQVVPNRVMVGVGAGGDVSIYNPAGYIDVVADVSGWFTDGSSVAGGSSFIGEVPIRIYDTRLLGASGPIPGGRFLALTGGPYAVTHVALVLNVTVANPTQPSYITVYPDDGNCTAPPPNASDLNFEAGEVVPNLTVAKLGPSTLNCSLAFDTYNPTGSVDVIYDENGFYGPVAAAPPVWVGAARVMPGSTPANPTLALPVHAASAVG